MGRQADFLILPPCILTWYVSGQMETYTAGSGTSLNLTDIQTYVDYWCLIQRTNILNVTAVIIVNVMKDLMSQRKSILRSVEFYSHNLRNKYVLTVGQDWRLGFLPLVFYLWKTVSCDSRLLWNASYGKDPFIDK
jgi:hypothetical protein